MVYEEDFVLNDETKKFKVDGKEFEYKLTTAEQENDWLNQYMIIENGEAKQDFTMLNKLKLSNLVGVPYDKETIVKVLGVEKEWKDLDINQRWAFLGKLKPALFTKIIQKISKLDSPDESVKN